MQQPAAQPVQPAVLADDEDHGNRCLSSLELARGLEVMELPLHDVSNVHLQELLIMLKSWRRLSGLGEHPALNGLP